MHSIEFDKLFDALPSPYMVLDSDLNFVAVNGAYETVTMRARGDLIGRNLFALFPNESESGRLLKASFERVFKTNETDTLAYLPYDIPKPAELGGGMETRYWSAVHTPLEGPDGNVAYLMQNTVDVTEIVRLREAAHLPFRAGEAQLLERAQEAERQHQALLAESDDFRRLFQQAPGFFAVLSGSEHVFTFANDAYVTLVGGRNVVGLPLLEALPEIEGQGFAEMLDKVFETGEPTSGQATRVMLQQRAGEAPRETFLDFSYDAIRDRDGQITGIFVQGMDRTEAVKTQRRQRLLLDELNHRVKNTLATVQSLASQTLRSATDLDSARKSFESRLVALSKAHDLLSVHEWTSAEIGGLVRQELSVYDRERVRISGSPVILRPKALIAIALLVHELSTNALAFGALSEESGTVSVSWQVDPGDDETLVVLWKESGGPPVEPPRRRGFGTRMIDRVVSGELGGTLVADHARAGFSYRVEIPGAFWRAEASDAIAS